MKLTNVQNFPEALVNAVRRQEYSKGDSDFSVTELISPPRISVLKKLHKDELTEDVSQVIYRLVGSIGHAILQKGAGEGISEKRLHCAVDGIKVSGQIDLVEKDSELLDFKFTSVWQVKDNSPQPLWVQQTNCYRYVAHRNGIEINRLSIVAVLRDWSVGDARRNPEYPQQQAILFSIPLWSHDATEKFLRDRIKAHLDARKTLPECTDDERWQKADCWAIMKEGRKSAVKLYWNEDAAKAHLATLDKKHGIVFRAGESVRCLSYCQVADFCEQWKHIQAKQKSAVEPDAF